MAGDYFRTVYDLMVLAFQTDVTRVATFSLGGDQAVQCADRIYRWQFLIMPAIPRAICALVDQPIMNAQHGTLQF